MRKFILLFLFISLGIGGTYAWFKYGKLFFETQAPQIELAATDAGLGLAGQELSVVVTEAGSGLDQVIVRAYQRRDTQVLKKIDLNGEKEVSFTVPLTKQLFEEGKLKVSIRAFDRGFWNNRSEVQRSFKVDFQTPQLSPLSTQHNVRRGGAQLLFYRVSDAWLLASGVMVGERKFLGFPAKLVDPEFTDPTIQAVIFAIDANLPLEGLALKLFAEDGAGNAKERGFNYRLLARRLGSDNQNVSAKTLARIRALAQSAGLSSSKPKELMQFVLSDMREKDKLRLNERLNAFSPSARSGKGHFYRNSGGLAAGFADTVSYFYGEQYLGKFLRYGYEINIPANDRRVLAAQDGEVIIAEDLGFYGTTVVVDHGLGLSTLYGHLGKIAVKTGDRVTREQVIGEIGSTGFAFGSDLWFQVLVQGVPVSPVEWWDRRWVNAHIDEKIEDIKRLVGIDTDEYED